MWKNEIFSLTEKNIVKSTTYLVILSSKTITFTKKCERISAQHCGYVHSHIKFRESNVFPKKVTKESISRKFLGVIAFYSTYVVFQTVNHEPFDEN